MNTAAHDEIVFGELTVIPGEYVAFLGEDRLPLTHKEFLLLASFARNPHRVMVRDRIALEVWGGEAPGRTIDIHVSRLRRRLPEGWIETVNRVGYRFAPQV